MSFTVTKPASRVRRGAVRNIREGDNFSSLPHFIKEIGGATNSEEVNRYLERMEAGDVLFLHSAYTYFGDTPYDNIIIYKMSTGRIGVYMMEADSADYEEYILDSSLTIQRIQDAIGDRSVYTLSRLEDERAVHLLFVRENGDTAVLTEEAKKEVANPVTSEYINNSAQAETNNSKQENTKMTKLAKVVDQNKGALVAAAKIEAGSIAMKQLTKAVKDYVPVLARGYLETPLGHLVLANIFAFAVNEYASNNRKAVVVSDAMVQGAMVDLMKSFNLNDVIEDIVGKVDLSKLTGGSGE